MKKRFTKLTSIIASLAIMAMMLPASVGAEQNLGNNLIANPGFESGTESWPKYGTVTMEVSTAEAHSGASSLLVSGRTATNSSPKQIINLKANTEYYVSFWVKPVSTTEKARGKVRFTGDGSLGLAMIDFPAGKWTQFTATFNSSNLAGVNNVDVYIGTSNTTGGNATFYLDDFELREVIIENPEAVVEGNMVSNAGFELGSLGGFAVSDCIGNVVDTNVHTGKYATLSENRKSNYAGVHATNITIEPDTYYYLGIYAMAGKETTAKAKVRLQKTEGNTAVTNTASNKTLSNTEYTLLDGVLYNKDATKGKIYVQTTESNLSASNYGVDLYTDDYFMLPITSSVRNGATGVAINSDITLTVPEAIAVTTDTLSINNGASITNIARTGRECVVSFSGMNYATEYTLTLTSGKGDNPAYTFTTEAAPDYVTNFTKIENTINCAFTNNVNTDKIMLAVAGYNAGGQLKYIQIDVSETTSETLTVAAPAEGTCAEVKVLLWNMRTFAPVCDALSIADIPAAE